MLTDCNGHKVGTLSLAVKKSFYSVQGRMLCKHDDEGVPNSKFPCTDIPLRIYAINNTTFNTTINNFTSPHNKLWLLAAGDCVFSSSMPSGRTKRRERKPAARYTEMDVYMEKEANGQNVSSYTPQRGVVCFSANYTQIPFYK